jgi:hypothetical protein
VSGALAPPGNRTCAALHLLVIEFFNPPFCAQAGSRVPGNLHAHVHGWMQCTGGQLITFSTGFRSYQYCQRSYGHYLCHGCVPAQVIHPLLMKLWYEPGIFFFINSMLVQFASPRSCQWGKLQSVRHCCRGSLRKA